MCGILAFCAPSSRNLPDSGAFDFALSIMETRGPNAGGTRCIEGDGGAVALFGHRRLSIQDLSAAGAQPMSSACKRFAITYNGEVYNAPALRRQLEEKGIRFRSTSDTEVILEGFAVWGKAILDKLHGMFAFAIWDRIEQKLTVARDHIGIKPLYYAMDDRGIALASDARALKAIGFGSTIDADSQALYLMLGYVPAPHSIWTGINKLEPGSFLEWSPGSDPKIGQFWSAPDALDHEGESQDLADLIDEVVEEQLLSDVPIGVFLSGGIDSSLIASSIAQLKDIKSDLVCLSVGFPENPAADEAPVAKRTAEALGLTLDVLPLAQGVRPSYREAVATLDEPLSFSAIVTQVAISRLAAEHGLTVVLTGDGGDEVFGGYVWYDTALANVHRRYTEEFSLPLGIFPSARARRKEALLDYDWAQSHPAVAHLQSVYSGMRPDQAAALLNRSEADLRELLLSTIKAHYVPSLPERRWRQRLDLYTFCADVVLPKVDRATMACSIEARPPLLDDRIIDWALSRPVTPENDGTPKAPLRAILKKRGLGFLLDEPKRGFSLKSKDKPSRKMMESEVDANRNAFPLSSDWRSALPKSAPLHGHRLALLHWFALWAEENAGHDRPSN
ncbi:MAG: asparagine synthase (glutamine-hydrolyzing) [Paracoccaceae bacterium]|nr:asparagine synthase (glutamine-hydrolyzing) [Paracoccaceae bacterium]